MLSSIGYSQVKISGTVSDSTKAPFTLANIIVKNTANGDIITYSITNSEGYYTVELDKGISVIMEISYVGMQTKSIPLNNINANRILNVTLFPDPSLEQIDLVYQMPITIRGDTTTYRTDHFSNGEEEVLGDVLKKLPGVEVDENGDVKVDGKSVGKVMVEGKDFFDGDTKLATKNIPADALKEIEVLKNHDDVAMMKGIRNNEDNIAINIKLKEGKKKFWFGNVSGGFGEPTRHVAKSNLFYYSPKYTVNFIGNMNNIGEAPISFQDYIKFSGGFESILSGEGTTLNGNDPFFRLTNSNFRAQNTESKFGGLSYSYALNKKTDITGFLLHSKNETKRASSETKTYTNPLETFSLQEKTAAQSNSGDQLTMLKAKLAYKPSPKTQINYTLNGRLITQDNEQESNSTISGLLEENNKAELMGIQQNFEWYQTVNQNNIFSVNASLSNEFNEASEYILFQDQTRFGFHDVLMTDTNEAFLKLNQQKDEKSLRAELDLKHWLITGKHSQFEYGLGSSLKKEKFHSQLYQNRSALHSDHFLTSNNLNYTTLDRYAKIGYRWKNKKITIQPSILLHAYKFNIDQDNTSRSFNVNKLLKNLSVHYKISNNQKIGFRYQENIELMSATNLALGTVLTGYNSLYRGNNLLMPSKSNTYQLDYVNFNRFYNYNINGNLYFSSQKNMTGSQINNRINTKGIVSQVFSTENINETQNTYMGNLNFSKTKHKLTLNTSIRSQVTESYQIFENQNQNNSNASFNYKASIRSNFKGKPNVELGYSEDRQFYEQNNLRSKFLTKKPFIKVTYKFKKHWMFSSDYTYNHFSTEGRTINEYSGMNLKLKYHKNETPWTFQASVSNLFNDSEINTNNASGIIVSNTIHFVSPRFIWFEVKYKL
ncbi:MAG: carboxypeptidase regulatory-like domain-containing protein [Flavobacteriales bacterium]